ncbi:hypothetical protein D3C71_1648740 [compost metagenome]
MQGQALKVLRLVLGIIGRYDHVDRRPPAIRPGPSASCRGGLDGIPCQQGNIPSDTQARHDTQITAHGRAWVTCLYRSQRGA